ncbi:universal stress protein [Microbacterium rhizomatis]|uniref:Universal stress protein n=1 Tax=Microbacterium rhizomatis TaxID=1631477 RepID=A0A5J5J9D1_9MICO|nr:universal stress protein [Microbacterium rhizomatis]KAA9111408.1 universal stress protein [Microbacterium rhizomatis]
MEAIVLGFDGSEASFAALDWVAQRAARKACRVEIVRIDPGVVVFDETDEFAFDEAERRILDAAPDAEVDSHTVIGSMPDTLVAASHGADLLVIGAHQHRPVRTALTGWRPLRTVAQAAVPTVVVPDDAKLTDGYVLVGVDDDDSSAEALMFAAHEAVAAGVDLAVLHAWQMPVPDRDGAMSLVVSPTETKAAHRRILEDACARLHEAHPDLILQKFLVQNNPTAALLGLAPPASLLVVGTHHRGVLAGGFLGSVAQDTLPAAPIPVCVVPALRDSE